MKLDRWVGAGRRQAASGSGLGAVLGRRPRSSSRRGSRSSSPAGGRGARLVLYAAPTILVVALGGMALAIVLSFPVRALSHVMPRGLAILVTFLGLLGLFALALGLPRAAARPAAEDLDRRCRTSPTAPTRSLWTSIDPRRAPSCCRARTPRSSQQPGQGALRPRPETSRRTCCGAWSALSRGPSTSGWPSSGCSSSRLPAGRRAQGQGGVPQDRAQGLPARRPRPVERLRRSRFVATSAGCWSWCVIQGATRGRRRSGCSTCPTPSCSASGSRPPRSSPTSAPFSGAIPAVIVAAVFEDASLDRLDDDARDPGGRGLRPDPAVRGQLPYPPHPGPRPPRPPHPGAPRRYRRRPAGRPRRRGLRRPAARRPPRLLRLSPGPPGTRPERAASGRPPAALPASR